MLSPTFYFIVKRHCCIYPAKKLTINNSIFQPLMYEVFGNYPPLRRSSKQLKRNQNGGRISEFIHKVI